MAGHWITAWREMPNESPRKILIVAFTLCLVCSVLVSTAAVVLRPLQEANQALDRKRNILRAAGLWRPGEDVQQAFKQVQTRIVDLAAGRYADDIDPAGYDQRAAAADPARSVRLPEDRDIAHIKTRAKYAPVYLVKDGQHIRCIILPIRGYGLWSVLYGYVALKGDARTVVGLTYYDQQETPGLGGEVDNPLWQAKWHDKLIYDEAGIPRIRVIKGTVDPSSPQARYEVDGISGATLTSRGVSNMMQYWLGQDGFGRFLARFRTEEGGKS
jgi:Na+-transporting NADH:ubiquinone oxidoreductase subunit C